MKSIFNIVTLIALLLLGCQDKKIISNPEFPSELVDFIPLKTEAIFAGTGGDTWDKMIRERGFILKGKDDWKLWYTGYNDDSTDTRFLGLATSKDGISWKRYENNPIYNDSWVEDMFVEKHNGTYYMFAEGRNDIMHWCQVSQGCLRNLV